ncbi:uncharacterized protein TNCV_3603031 [Trichonephila clavipes]|nr:uncharacterized protein TNCV_3603031 [Trichonephila clavipes]
MVEIEGRSVLTKFLILPKAKGNRTLLGTDFLSSAGLVLDVKNTCWYFWDNPTHKYPFGEELDPPSIVEKMSSKTCQLREGEGGSLSDFGRELRTPSEVVDDIRVVIQNDNFMPEITPYLKKLAKFSTQIREVVEEQQDSRKFYAD